MKQALKKAGQKLMYIPRFEDHTVYHNMWAQFQRSKIFIHKKQEGDVFIYEEFCTCKQKLS